MNGTRRALVTGGAGFIGSHLVDRLLDDGHEVIVLDNFTTGRYENLAQFSDETRLSIHEVDIAEPEQIQSYFKEVEWVFHLAALADIVPSIQQPIKYHRSNVDGTVAVLEAARSCGVKRFMYAASSSCYGIADELPTPETAPVRPMYPYALTKYLGEHYVLHWNTVYGIPCEFVEITGFLNAKDSSGTSGDNSHCDGKTKNSLSPYADITSSLGGFFITLISLDKFSFLINFSISD